jgi:hypothetical protein
MTGSSDSKGPGATAEGAPQLPPEWLQALAQDITMQLQQLIPIHLPELKVTQEQMSQVVSQLVQEQLYIGSKVMPTFAKPEEIEACPRAQILIRAPSGKEAVFVANKRANDDPIDALISALMLAFLISAPVRGLLLLKGFQYRFQQIKAQSSIVMP